jgi:NADPH-dependent glutamate synthase beta subunit-like oxidoreductase
MNISGEDLERVYAGGDYLRNINLGARVALGKRVAVVGGGNVAMDAARTAVRLGAEEVHVLYRRGREEMPANPEEIEEAEEEGIKFHYLTAPTAVLGNGSREVREVRCIRMELGEPDESGRRRPIPVPGSEYEMPMDSVISAIGLSADLSFFDREPETLRPILSRWGTLVADSITYATNIPGVFTGGDVATGAATVIQAIAAGKQVAISIDRYLQGEDLVFGRGREDEVCEIPPVAVEKAKRMVMQRYPARERKTSFQEINLGFTEQQAREEAKRCLQCGVCSTCFRCDSAKATGAKPVIDYLRMQRRFRHLTDVEIQKIQARINADYEALLERCGISRAEAEQAIGAPADACFPQK